MPEEMEYVRQYLRINKIRNEIKKAKYLFTPFTEEYEELQKALVIIERLNDILEEKIES